MGIWGTPYLFWDDLKKPGRVHSMHQWQHPVWRLAGLNLWRGNMLKMKWCVKRTLHSVWKSQEFKKWLAKVKILIFRGWCRPFLECLEECLFLMVWWSFPRFFMTTSVSVMISWIISRLAVGTLLLYCFLSTGVMVTTLQGLFYWKFYRPPPCASWDYIL